MATRVLEEMEGQKRKRVISQRLLTSPLWATGAKVLPKTQGHSIPKAPVGCWSPVVWAGVREPARSGCCFLVRSHHLIHCCRCCHHQHRLLSCSALADATRNQVRSLTVPVRTVVSSLFLSSCSALRWQNLNRNQLACESGKYNFSLTDI